LYILRIPPCWQVSATFHDLPSDRDLNAATGGFEKLIAGFGYGFNDPAGISSDGTHVWVASFYSTFVTELSASTGALVRAIRGFAFKFDNPSAVSSDGTDVWVANSADGTVTAFPPSG
jgi:DNA-binding beta-propeller fold protein YncE